MARVLDTVTMPIKKNGTKTPQVYINNPKSTAPQFSALVAYAAGQIVFNEKKLYRFKTAHPAGAWNAAHVEEITVASELNAHGEELTQLKADFTQLDETAAKIDGSYDTMTVGNAKQLTSNVGINDKAPYLFRTAGGANDIGDREEDTIVGGSVVWNQLMPNPADWVVQTANTPLVVDDIGGTLTATPDIRAYHPAIQGTRTLNISVEGHKYLINIEFRTPDNDGDSNPTLYHSSTAFPTFGIAGSSKADWNRGTVIKSATSTGGAIVGYLGLSNATSVLSDGDRLQFRNVQCFDLTAMFGSTIADYIYGLEQSQAGAGVAWFRKLFPKDYYEYCAPTIKSVEGLVSHKMTGFNAYDNTTGKAKVVGGNVYQITGTYTGLSLDGETVTPDTDGYFTPAISGELTVTGGNATNTCVHLKWDGERDGEYEAYKEYTYPLDSDVVLRGIPKLDANNDLYYDGDTYEADGTVTRKYGIVDLGTLNWTKDPNRSGVFYTGGLYSTIKRSSPWADMICDGYVLNKVGPDLLIDKGISSTNAYGAGDIFLKDSAFADYTSAQVATALSGKMLLYELHELAQTTETADPFQTPQVVDDWGTEEYVYTDGAFPIPVGHDTFYAANLKAKLEMAPDSPGDGDGDYIVRQTNGLNEYVKMVKELPSAPTTDGSYHLEVTVASGTPTLTWVADT